jgi:hypothetical protein
LVSCWIDGSHVRFPSSTGGNLPINSGFELPDLGQNPATSYLYSNQLSAAQLAACGWTFPSNTVSGAAEGISANGSYFNTAGATDSLFAFSL